MREVKFRAWDKRQEIMVSNEQVMRLEFGKNGVDWLGCWVVVADSQGKPEQGLHQIAKEDLVFMQFTGLKDKSGKEIYEGDIIWKEFSHRKGQKRESKEDGHKFQIIYQPAWSSFVADEIVKIGEFQELWHLAQNNKWADQERLIVDEFEIIGNIYQNPELLK